MFTGIIQATSEVMDVREESESRIVRIRTPREWQLSEAQSISVDGVCSTVSHTSSEWFEVMYMPETISKTTVSSFAKDTLVNLERSLRMQDFVDGHMVQGHVDGVAKITSLTNKGESRELEIEPALVLMRYIAARGSVALNGVSLTVARRTDNAFVVALIPYTIEHTNLKNLNVGASVNIETDMLARYLEALQQEKQP